MKVFHDDFSWNNIDFNWRIFLDIVERRPNMKEFFLTHICIRAQKKIKEIFSYFKGDIFNTSSFLSHAFKWERRKKSIRVQFCPTFASSAGALIQGVETCLMYLKSWLLTWSHLDDTTDVLTLTWFLVIKSLDIPRMEFIFNFIVSL